MMKNYSRFLATATAAAVISSIAVPNVTHADSQQFRDLPPTHPFYKEIMTLVNDQIINGYEDNTYRPSTPLIRKHASFLFTRSLGLEPPENLSLVLSKYMDVELNSDVASHIAAMDAAGILLPSDVEFRENDNLTREEMASWLVRAFDLEPKDDVEVTLSDLDRVAPEHVDNVKILFQNSITKGKADGTFSPKEAVDRGQFAVFLYRAIQSQLTVEQPNSMLHNIGDELSLPKTITVSYLDQSIERAVEWNTESLDIEKEGTYTLLGTIKGTDKKAHLEVEVKAVPLEIEELEANGLKQMIITLNHRYFDPSIFSNKDHYIVKNELGDQIDILSAIPEDNKIFLNLQDSLDNNSTATVSLSDKLMEIDEPITVKIKDANAPKIDKVDILGKTQLKVYFSEPLNFGLQQNIIDRQVFNSIYIDDSNSRISSIVADPDQSAITLELYSSLFEGKHSLDFDSYLADYANYKLESDEIDFTVNYDKTVPRIAEILQVKPNEVIIKFNEPIQFANTDDVKDKISIRETSIQVEQALIQNNNELLLSFGQNNLLPVDEKLELVIEKGAISDLWGNNNTYTNEEIRVENDEIDPFIENARMLEKGEASSDFIQVELTFNEALDRNSLEKNTQFVIKDADENQINVQSFTFSDNAKHVILTLGKTYEELGLKTYTVSVTGAIDLFENKGDSSKRLEIGSVNPPKDFEANIIKNDNNISFTIDFNKPMETTGDYSVADLGKYELTVDNEKILLSKLLENNLYDVDLDTHYGGKSVQITITPNSGSSLAIYDDLKNAVSSNELNRISLVVGMLADQEGVKTVSFYNKISLKVKNNFTSETAEATDSNTVELLLNDTVEYFDENDIVIYADLDRDGEFDEREELGKEIRITTDENGKSKLVADLKVSLENNGTYNDNYLYATTQRYTSTVNRFGQRLQINNVRVSDAIAAELKSYNGTPEIYVHPSSESATKAIISIPFEEEIDQDTVTRLSFAIASGDYTISAATVARNVIYLHVVLPTGKKVEDLKGEQVVQKMVITDSNDNKIENIKALIQGVKSEINP